MDVRQHERFGLYYMVGNIKFGRGEIMLVEVSELMC